jgi:hypothetical protein
LNVRGCFIDEAWIKTNMAPMAPQCGWSPRGSRLYAKVPWGHWNTMTFIAALKHDRIDAPWVLDGPINGESFRTHGENEPMQTLTPGALC